MDLVVDLSDRAERATALYRALLDAMRSGRLMPGDRLPASRALAADVGVARSTVSTAYERLVAEGYLDARVGDGTYVTDLARAARPPDRAREMALRPRRSAPAEPSSVSGQRPPPAFDFRAGIPDATLFPYDTWRRLLSAEVRAGRHSLGTYADPAGFGPLREAVVRHLALSRGVTAMADEVLVTHGSQQALDLVARVLLEPGDRVAVEDPGYPQAAAVFAARGAEVVPVRVDDEGLVVEELPGRCRLVFTTPSHQFPLGPPLSLRRRRALLAHAEAHRTAVVEDDYDSEYRFTERPLETLFSLDRSGRVLYLGTFSKSLVPGLRLGYVVAPATLQPALRAVRQLADGFVAVPEQAALARLIDDGLLARHTRRARAAYAERRDQVLAALAGPLAGHLEAAPSAAGLHVTALFHDQGRDDRAVVAAAEREGVAVESLSSYCRGAPRQGLVIGYGATPTATVTPGMRRLAGVLDAM